MAKSGPICSLTSESWRRANLSDFWWSSASPARKRYTKFDGAGLSRRKVSTTTEVYAVEPKVYGH